MSDWIKVRAEEIRSAEREKKLDRDRKAEASVALKAKVEPFWNALAGLLQASVKDFNLEFPETERQIDQFERPSAGVIVLRRSFYPVTQAKVQLSTGSTSLNYSLTRTDRRGAEPVESQGNIPVCIADGNAAYADTSLNHEAVAQLLMEPFFQF